MGHGGRTGERLEMVAARAGNYTPVVEEFDLWVTRMECLYLVYFHHHYRILPHDHLGIAVGQTAHPVELYWLTAAEIYWSTLYVNKMVRVIK
jgi:hypothetical protein